MQCNLYVSPHGIDSSWLLVLGDAALVTGGIDAVSRRDCSQCLAFSREMPLMFYGWICFRQYAGICFSPNARCCTPRFVFLDSYLSPALIEQGLLVQFKSHHI